MKKLISLFLMTGLLLSLAACGRDTSAVSSGGEGSQANTGTEWPKKSIQIVVPYNAGGDTDYYARTTARYLEDILGQSIVVVNTEGASGTTGALSVLDQEADGYTFLFGHQTVLFNQAAGTTPFDYLTDFVAVGSPLTDNTYGLYCHKDAPYSTLEELAAYCKEHPGEVSTIAATGGSSGMNVALMEEALGGIEFRWVEGPSSSAEKLAGFLGGQYDLLTGNFAQYKDYIAEGTIVPLGNYGSKDVEALTELGVYSWITQGYDHSEDYMFMLRAKAGTDQAVIDKMADALREVCKNPDYQEEIAVYNATVEFQDGDACLAYEKEYYQKALDYLANQEA